MERHKLNPQEECQGKADATTTIVEVTEARRIRERRVTRRRRVTTMLRASSSELFDHWQEHNIVYRAKTVGAIERMRSKMRKELAEAKLDDNREVVDLTREGPAPSNRQRLTALDSAKRVAEAGALWNVSARDILKRFRVHRRRRRISTSRVPFFTWRQSKESGLVPLFA